MKNLESIKNNKRFDSLEKKSLSKCFGGQQVVTSCGTGGGGKRLLDGSTISWSCDESFSNGDMSYYNPSNDAAQQSRLFNNCCN